MPHVFADFDDRILMRSIMDRCEDRRLFALDEILLPYQARAVLGSSAFVVSQRMHGAISGFQAGVPALSLSYSHKFRDVIGNYLGFPELVVDVDRTRFSSDLETCFPAIEAALRNLSALRSRLEEARSRAQGDALRQIEDVAGKIGVG
jgi:colanic acid/amylovoran biosynthesis protein